MDKNLKTTIETISEISKQFKKETLNTPEQNKSAACLGKNRLDAVMKIFDIINSNPEILPASFNLEEVEKSHDYYFQVKELMTEIENLQKIVTDIYVDSGKDLFCKSMKIKKYIDNLSDTDYKTIKDEISYFFKKYGKKLSV